MTGQNTIPTDGDKRTSLAAGRAAGYCWRENPNGPGRCTLPPHHDGGHVDHYNGRRSPADISGYRWP